MPRFYLIVAIIALGAFNVAQYRNWSLFADEANAQAIRSPNAARAFHK